MASPNKHIEDYLKYYCYLSTPPEYAVLIKGLWGSGKTWFIKNFIEKLDGEKCNPIYVSLYGIKDTKEIERLLISALITKSHKILESKLIRKVSKSLNKVLGDKVPEIDIVEYLPNKEKYIFVFDDLERCSINVNDVLGYINRFVEHHNLKVIIVADESKIHGYEKTQGKNDTEKAETKEHFLYKNIKEKLIGDTFEVKVDIESVINDFIEFTEDDEVKSFYRSNESLITKIYVESAFNNLRHLKRALFGFSRLFKGLHEEIRKNDEVVKDLFHMYLVYTFEIKSGNLSPEKLVPDFNLESDEKAETPFKKINKKYADLPIFSFHSPILEVETWEEIFGKGLIDNETININLMKSGYFDDEDQPDWLRLLNYWDLTDEEFAQYLNKVEVAFQNNEFEDIGVVKHVVAEFLYFSKIGIYSKPIKEILEISKSYITYLREEGKLPSHQDDRHRWNHSYKGYVFLDDESKTLQEFCSFIDQNIDEAMLGKLPLEGEELIQLLINDTSSFVGKLIHMADLDCTFYDIPVLSHVDQKKFVDSFLGLSPSDQQMAMKVFRERYKFPSKAFDELDWLKSISKLLDEQQSSLKGQLSGYRISKHNLILEKAITFIETNKKAAR